MQTNNSADCYVGLLLTKYRPEHHGGTYIAWRVYASCSLAPLGVRSAAPWRGVFCSAAHAEGRAFVAAPCAVIRGKNRHTTKGWPVGWLHAARRAYEKDEFEM